MTKSAPKNHKGEGGTPPAAPAYWRIENDLRARIREGAWAVGAMLPSRQDLAREYGVARATVERAVASLIADGTLRADDGRGTFVASTDRDPAPETIENQAVVSTAPRILLSPEPVRARVAATLGIVGSLSRKAMDAGSIWLDSIVSAVERAFSGPGVMTRFYNREQEDASLVPTREAVASLVSEGVDALVIIAIWDMPAALDDPLVAAEAARVPVVYITWDSLRRPVAHIYYDQQCAGYEAGEHLLQQGYRDLIFLTPFSAGWVADRLAGTRHAVRDAGPSTTDVMAFPEPITAYPVSSGSVDAYEIFRRREVFEALELDPTKPPRGIIAPCDATAYGFLRAAEEFGKAPGRDFGLIGFDDGPNSRTVGLTSLRPPFEALGQEAVGVVWRLLRGETMNLQVRLHSHLLPRASTQQYAPRSWGQGRA